MNIKLKRVLKIDQHTIIDKMENSFHKMENLFELHDPNFSSDNN